MGHRETASQRETETETQRHRDGGNGNKGQRYTDVFCTVVSWTHHCESGLNKYALHRSSQPCSLRDTILRPLLQAWEQIRTSRGCLWSAYWANEPQVETSQLGALAQDLPDPPMWKMQERGVSPPPLVSLPVSLGRILESVAQKVRVGSFPRQCQPRPEPSEPVRSQVLGAEPPRKGLPTNLVRLEANSSEAPALTQLQQGHWPLQTWDREPRSP